MIPGWLSTIAFLLTVLSPVILVACVLLGSYLTRMSDRDRDVWRHREETMRTVRWAVEHILADETAGVDAGIVTLRSLMRSELLQPEDYDLVAALTATAAIDRVGSAPSQREIELAQLHVESARRAGRAPEPAIARIASLGSKKTRPGGSG
ncbi:hypothetical protein [Kribbella jiaozuonensis]|uniref:hypothetical protein n=1 Tax=Kribbella jiaozuonensis TaxID=2575441 RepID=UPI00192DA652|nr:hypothetical protein [Kribbella jiaozuonensis]